MRGASRAGGLERARIWSTTIDGTDVKQQLDLNLLRQAALGVLKPVAT